MRRRARTPVSGKSAINAVLGFATDRGDEAFSHGDFVKISPLQFGEDVR